MPKYNITSRILFNIGKIEAAKEIIENAALVPAWEAKFKTDALVRTVHHGTHIEGNPLTRDEAQRLVEAYSPVDEPWMVASKAEVVAKDRDIQEVINYRNVMDYLDKVSGKKDHSIWIFTALVRLIQVDQFDIFIKIFLVKFCCSYKFGKGLGRV
jgi:Fic family protein